MDCHYVTTPLQESGPSAKWHCGAPDVESDTASRRSTFEGHAQMASTVQA